MRTVKKTGKNPKFTVLSLSEKNLILHMSGKGRAIGEISRAVERSESTVSRFLARMADTSDLARATIKAGTATLAERIIKKATVGEAIEVLSRPGIDVIQPAPQKGVGGQGWGIQVSVGVASCGTVVHVEAGNVERQIGESEPGGIDGVGVGVGSSGTPEGALQVIEVQGHQG